MASNVEGSDATYSDICSPSNLEASGNPLSEGPGDQLERARQDLDTAEAHEGETKDGEGQVDGSEEEKVSEQKESEKQDNEKTDGEGDKKDGDGLAEGSEEQAGEQKESEEQGNEKKDGKGDKKNGEGQADGSEEDKVSEQKESEKQDNETKDGEGEKKDGEGPNQRINRASRELVEMVRPSSGSPALAQEIWDKVVEGARLPGTWEATVAGALDAVRGGDWPLGAYLAARCFSDNGGSGGGGAMALAKPDDRCCNTLWLEVASPMVLEVPRGQERLCVKFEGFEDPEWFTTDQLGDVVSRRGQVFVLGHGRGSLVSGPNGGAEQFNIGATLELSQVQWKRPRLRRLSLEDGDWIEVRNLLLRGGPDANGSAFLNRAERGHAPGNWFHVLAFPFAGDVTKALIRPAARSWAASQREAGAQAVHWLGETLVAQCAKASQWAFVEMLFKAGVPCPDLSREFDDVCGGHPLVRPQWRRDLLSTTNSRGTPSLLELAAWASAPVASSRPSSGEPTPLQRIVSALRARGGPLELTADAGGRRPPLIVVSATACRWDVVKELLGQPDDVFVNATALLESQASLRAPAAVLRLAASRRAIEATQVKRPQSILEYFRRRHAGEVMGTESSIPEYLRRRKAKEVMGTESLPHGCQLEDGKLCAPGGHCILDLVLRLATAPKPGPGVDIAFVSISTGDCAEALAVAADVSCAVLPLDLTGRHATTKDSALAGGGAWAAVLCPTSYLQKCEEATMLKFAIPLNSVPMPFIVRNAVVRVTIFTPCCVKPLPGAVICASGRPLTMTDDKGLAQFELPPGSHTLTAPQCSSTETVLRIEQGATECLTFCPPASGDLFVFLQDNSPEDNSSVKDSVMLCANIEDIPDDARPFIGTVSLPGGRPPSRRLPSKRFPASVCVACGAICSNSLHSLRIQNMDGRAFELDEDFKSWCEEFKEECQLGLLFENPPKCLGNLLGPPPAQAALPNGTAQGSVMSSSLRSDLGSRGAGPAGPMVGRHGTPTIRDDGEVRRSRDTRPSSATPGISSAGNGPPQRRSSTGGASRPRGSSLRRSSEGWPRGQMGYGCAPQPRRAWH